MLKTTVKVSSITNLSDARYCAGMGVEMVGFVMDKFSSEYISPEKMKEIKSWLAGVKIVGETQSTDYKEIIAFLNDYEIDILQISEANLFPKIAELNIPIILKLDSDSAYLEDNMEKYSANVEYFLLEGEELTDLMRYELKDYASRFSIILGLGIEEKTVNELLDELPIKGIALKGSNEIRPGFKNYDELMEILEVLEVD